jgi:hypothetical protein
MNDRNYKSRRSALIVTTIGVSIFTFGYIVGNGDAKSSEFHCPEAPITVNNGDTVYDLARANCTGNFISVVDEVVRVYGSDLDVGQKLYLPKNSDCKLRMTNGGEVFEDCK